MLQSKFFHLVHDPSSSFGIKLLDDKNLTSGGRVSEPDRGWMIFLIWVQR